MKVPMVNMRREVELVLCCSRTYMDAEHAKQLWGLLQEDLDWAYLLQTAHRHGVMPLLYCKLIGEDQVICWTCPTRLRLLMMSWHSPTGMVRCD